MDSIMKLVMLLLHGVALVQVCLMRKQKLDETFQGSCDLENRDCNCVDSSFAECSESEAENKVIIFYWKPRARN